MTIDDATRRQFLYSVNVFSAAALTQPAEFRDFYFAALQSNGIVGSTFLLIRDNTAAIKQFHGYSDLANKTLVDWNTCYHWASITKTYTAIAILQLRDRRRLRLDDSVSSYIPELRQIHNPYGSVESITIRHLLTHSAGFRNPTWPWRTESWQPFEPTKWSQILAMLPYTNVEFPPGSRHSYSNLGIIFLGQIIERLTDDDYEVYIDKNILKPLEMHQTYFDQSPYHLLRYRSHSYFLEKGKLSEAPFDFDTGITVSNGGLNSPFPDMQKYLFFLLGDPRESRYDTILKRSSLDEMFGKELNVTSSDSSQLAGAQGTDSIGLGFFRHEEGGRLYIGHGGNQNGFLSHFYLDPQSRAAYLVAFNTDATDATKNTGKLDLKIRTYLLERKLAVS
ncbi:MAG: serine hydrolase domain-containing protein [Bryobacteraceae bacterium]